MNNRREDVKKQTIKAGLKQKRVDQMAQQRKNNRATSFAVTRQAFKLIPSPASSEESTSIPETVKTANKTMGIKKNIKESLQKWKEEKERRLAESKKKNNKPEFKVSAHVEAKPAKFLPVPSKKTTYQNVAPKVVSRRVQNAQLVLNLQVPEKFSFKENVVSNSKQNVKPFIFAAPVDARAKPGKVPKAVAQKKVHVAFGSMTPRATSTTPKKFPVTPRPTSKSGSKPNQTSLQKSVELTVSQTPALRTTSNNANLTANAPVKNFIVESPESPQVPSESIDDNSKELKTAEVPPAKKRKTAEFNSAKKTKNANNKSSKPVEENESNLSTDYFREILDNEINCLEQQCLMWEAEKGKVDMPQEVEEKVLLAIGMARLLIREKFNQFRGLIDNCENPEDPKTRTLLSDLQGFWDMIKIQADNISASFVDLDKLKSNDWKEDENVQVPKAAPRKKAAPKPTKPAVSSRFKDFLAKKKAIEAPQKTPIAMKATPNKRKSGCKTPLSNSKLRIESPNANAMMHVTQIAKSAERKSLDHLTRSMNETVDASSAKVSPVKPLVKNGTKTEPLHEARVATPSRSILKKPENTPTISKGSKCVLFDMIPEEAEEDYNNLTIQPVTHTYSHKKHEVSPVQDKFDQLLEKTLASKSPALSFSSSLPSSDKNIGEKEINQSNTLSPIQSVRRSARLNTPKSPNVLTLLDQSINLQTPDKVPKRKLSRKRTSVEASLVELKENDDVKDQTLGPLGPKRRSSRKRTITSEEITTKCSSDLMSFDSPAVTVAPKKRKSSSAKKAILDQSL